MHEQPEPNKPPDLNQLRDDVLAGKDASYLRKGEPGEMHLVNPDLHPGEDMGPDLEKLRQVAKERRARLDAEAATQETNTDTE